MARPRPPVRPRPPASRRNLAHRRLRSRPTAASTAAAATTATAASTAAATTATSPGSRGGLGGVGRMDGETRRSERDRAEDDQDQDQERNTSSRPLHRFFLRENREFSREQRLSWKAVTSEALQWGASMGRLSDDIVRHANAACQIVRVHWISGELACLRLKLY